MKRILFLFSLALLAGGLSAFTGHRQPHKSDSSSALHYFYVTGNNIGSYIGDYDPAVPADWLQLQADSFCEDNPVAEICALGFDTMDPESPAEGTDPIRKTQ